MDAGSPEGREDEGVRARLMFLSPSSRINRRYVSPAGQINYSEYVPHEVRVRDARALSTPATLDTHGFALTRDATTLDDLRTESGIERYIREAEAHVARCTGADRVFQVAWMRRSASPQRPNDVHPPSNDVHVDYTSDLAHWMAERVLGREGLRAADFDHFVTINHWRPLTSPPQNWPLALCESASADASDAVAHGILHVDALPDPGSVTEILPPDPTRPRSLDFVALRFNPAHRWYRFPDMTPDEVVLFKSSDSRFPEGAGVPHGSFEDPTCARDATPRESIEVRTIAFFLPK